MNTDKTGLSVSVPDSVLRLHQSKAFQRLRYTIPIAVLLIFAFITGFPALGNEYLLLIPVLVSLCTNAMRYSTAALSARSKKPCTTVLQLKDDEVLELRLGGDSFQIPLSECRCVRIQRLLWWVSPHLIFTIERNDGFERQFATQLDLPELYNALRIIERHLRAEHQVSTHPPPQAPKDQ